MADDIFLSQEEQDERAKQWLKDNGAAIFMGIALGLGGVFGFNYFQDYRQAQAEQASSLYTKVIDISNESTVGDITSLVESLKEDYTNTAYAAKAALIRAKQLATTNLDAAFDELQWVIDNAEDHGLAQVARLRQIKLKVEQNQLDEAFALANQESFGGFSSHYNELLGDIKHKQGEIAQAREYYQTALSSLTINDFSYRQVLDIKVDRLGLSDADTE